MFSNTHTNSSRCLYTGKFPNKTMSPCLPCGLYIWFYYNIFSLVICVCGLSNPLAFALSLPRALAPVWIGNNSSYTSPFPRRSTPRIPYTRSTLYFFSFWFFSPESVETYCPRTKHLCIRHPRASCLLPPFFIPPPLASPPASHPL